MSEEPPPDPASAVEPEGEAPTDPDAELAARLRGNGGRGMAWFLLQIIFVVGTSNPLADWLRSAGFGFWASLGLSVVVVVVCALLWLRFLTRPAPPSSGVARYAPYALRSPVPFAWIVLVHFFASTTWSGFGRGTAIPWGWGMASTLALSALALLVARWVYRTPPDPSPAR